MEAGDQEGLLKRFQQNFACQQGSLNSAAVLSEADKFCSIDVRDKSQELHTIPNVFDHILESL